MIIKVIDTSQCTECDFNDCLNIYSARPDGNKVAFGFEEDSVPDFFKDKTSYTQEQFTAMTKDPADAWYMG